MRWWFKTRFSILSAATLVALIAATIALSGLVVTVPTVFGGGGSDIAAVLFLPMGLAALIAYVVDPRVTVGEARSVRAIRMQDAILCTAIVAAFVLACILAGRMQGPMVAANLARNAVILSSLTILVSWLTSAAVGALTSTLAVLLTTAYAARNTGSQYVRFLQPEGDPGWATALSVGLAVAAITTMIVIKPTDQRHQE